MWRLRPSALAGALWALVATMVARKRLRRDGLRATSLKAPSWNGQASRAAQGVLARLEPTCLERALVDQAWRLAHGDRRDIVIGVPRQGMSAAPAHAWLDGLDAASPLAYQEIHRLAPPA